MQNDRVINRKPTRLKGFDYTTPGAYFVTVCIKDKKHILAEISKCVGEGLCALPEYTLSPIGQEVENSIAYINQSNENVVISKHVIRPNHLHMIVEMTDAGGGGTPPLQSIVGRIKSYTTKKYGAILWQRSFHDHIIRNETDYQKIWGYIDTNVLKWEQDCFFNS